MNKTIVVDITDYDVRMFQELVDETREPFTWHYKDVDVKFIKTVDHEDEEQYHE